MNGFALTLLDSRGAEHFDTVTQFIGADTDGSFGILAGHIHCVALLRYGLARFCDQADVWHYLALPSGVLRFADNQLTVTTVRYFLGKDRDSICERLAAEMALADSEVHTARATLSEIEHSLVRRLAELSSRGSAGIVP
ncbi:F0F1 ATP synthase subunit epsilon [Methylomonas sp. EFPC1]|uniref:F0F1 ATP synthase subunit epsilon n=1 Tax=Methylomonas sp. EFPC1 TaxID=2812647 RepID=UPI001966D844|nr:F0F1 ATP synthase subunit epsilon [Methylomonas sp. EFPC1]QSB00908.1 F0F1 ATP synthase subunit epsilon [Methylomonas sp. EFPC1]